MAMRILESIVLAICKVYENEKRYELNSIQGVLNSLSHRSPSLKADEREVRDFISQYGGPSGPMDPMAALQTTFDGFKQNTPASWTDSRQLEISSLLTASLEYLGTSFHPLVRWKICSFSVLTFT